MADSQGQNYYWQSDNQNTTGENVGAVLDDLCDIVVITEIQNNQNTVTFVPGLNGERGHFRLGVGSKPINADKYTILTATGSPDNYAEGNEVEVKLKKVMVTLPDNGGSFETYSAQFETDEVNCFSFYGLEDNVEPTIFVMDKGSRLLMGQTPVHDYEEGIWVAPTFWDEDIPYPRLILDGAAQIMMQPKDDMQMPIIQMDGGAIMRFNYNKEHPYYNCFRTGSRNVADSIRRYEDPFGLVKNDNYTSSGIPIFSMHDSSTFQMLDNAVFQAKNGSQTVIQGNTRVHISGGQWSDGYHARSHVVFTAELIRTSSSTDKGTITFDISDVMFTKKLYEVHCEYIKSRGNYNLVYSIYEIYNGQPGVTITYDNLTEQEFLDSSNFRQVIIKTFSVSAVPYQSSIEDFDKITEIDIGPNTLIRTQCDTENANKGALISVEPRQIRMGIGEFEGDDRFNTLFIGTPDYRSALNHAGPIKAALDYDFPIGKNFLSLQDDAPILTLVGDLVYSVPDPYFEITGGSALKIDQNALVIRSADYSSGIVDQMEITTNSYLANMFQAGASSRVKIYKSFTNSDAVENTFVTGKYSKDINFHGKTSIRFGPKEIEMAGQMRFGLDMSGNRTDIVGHWDNFQAILSGKDSFINWDGNNHYESWSGTQIFRASNPTRETQSGTYYPSFTGQSGSASETKTIEVQKDISSYTNQQIADEFGSQLTPAKPADAWNRVYDNPVLNVNGITKTLIGNNYVQSVDIQTNSAKETWISAASVYIYSDTNYASYSDALGNATIKELFGRALNFKGTWTFNNTPYYTHTWDSSVGKYKLRIYNAYISYKTGMGLLCPSTGTTTPSDFNLPANTIYSDMTAAQRSAMDRALTISNNKIYDSNGALVAWSTSGTVNNKSYIKTATTTNYSVVQTGATYSVTGSSTIPWHQTPHLNKDWRGPIQTADRIGQNPSNWEKGPIVQAYGPINLTIREKWTADSAHTKTFDLTSSETYDVSNQAQAIADFEANATDYAAFEAYLTQEGYTLWDIISIATATGGYTITFSICEAGWKPHVDSYPDNPVVEITDGSELRLYGGVKVKGETKYGVTTFTFSGTQTEGEVSFTLDELRSLKALIGSVRTAVVNDASQATESGTLYFIDEGGNA